MKFWMTVIVGVAALSSISTFMVVLRPDMARKTNRAKPEAVKPKATRTGMEPKVSHLDGLSRVVENVGQNKEGQSTYAVRNDGKSTLQLKAEKTSCTCTALYVSKEPLPITAKGSDLVQLAPGESGVVTARWNTNGKVGTISVGGTVGTSDPDNPTFIVKVELRVVQDALVSAEVLSLGEFVERSPSTNSVFIYSTLRDDLDLKEVSITNANFTPSVAPMSKEELAPLNAKSGRKLSVSTRGELPVGFFSETLSYTIHFKDAVDKRTIPVRGKVVGEISLEPERVDFGVVRPETLRPREVAILWPKLPKSEALSIGKVSPGFVTAKLSKDPKYARWTLAAEIVPKSAQAGPIMRGSIEIVDSKGQVRLTVPVRGTIDPSVSEGR